MQLVAGGEPTGRGEGHARYAGPDAVQSSHAVQRLSAIDWLDDQADALLLLQLKSVDGLQHALGKDRFGDLHHGIRRLSEATRLPLILPHWVALATIPAPPRACCYRWPTLVP